MCGIGGMRRGREEEEKKGRIEKVVYTNMGEMLAWLTEVIPPGWESSWTRSAPLRTDATGSIFALPTLNATPSYGRILCRARRIREGKQRPRD